MKIEGRYMKQIKKTTQIKDQELEKLTKIIKEAYKNAEEFTKRDLKNSSNLNFKVC